MPVRNVEVDCCLDMKAASAALHRTFGMIQLARTRTLKEAQIHIMREIIKLFSQRIKPSLICKHTLQSGARYAAKFNEGRIVILRRQQDRIYVVLVCIVPRRRFHSMHIMHPPLATAKQPRCN